MLHVPAMGTSNQPVPAQVALADTHGIWFSAADGIYLYTNGAATNVSNQTMLVAGSCA
jgi:hypothetical protein